MVLIIVVNEYGVTEELWIEVSLHEFRPAFFRNSILHGNLASDTQQTYKATGIVGQSKRW